MKKSCVCSKPLRGFWLVVDTLIITQAGFWVNLSFPSAATYCWLLANTFFNDNSPTTPLLSLYLSFTGDCWGQNEVPPRNMSKPDFWRKPKSSATHTHTRPPIKQKSADQLHFIYNAKLFVYVHTRNGFFFFFFWFYIYTQRPACHYFRFGVKMHEVTNTKGFSSFKGTIVLIIMGWA